MSTESAIVPGQILLQKYRVEELLGHGGMGVVFAARHLALDERVAIKVLAPAVSQHQQALARLQREARILARVRNEHVVRVIDLGQLEDGAPFMVMEHLTGRDLASLLDEQGRLGVESAVGYVLQALVALAAAHANGVVHRDLKPENLFCARGQDGTSLIKVLDFGISRLERLSQGSGPTPMTGPTAVMGTPLYMSPEQLRDPRVVDARSDIWSVGVVLYELVSGVAPFSGASLGDIAIKIATEAPPSLAALDPSLPSALESVLSKCLCKERNQRFANVAELARALQPFGPAGCERLVERVERLATEPPVQFPEDDRPALGAAGSALVTRLVAPTSLPQALGPTPPVAIQPSSRTPLWLVLTALPLLLVAAWWLTTSHDDVTLAPASAAGGLEPQAAVEVPAAPPRIAATAAGPEVLPPANHAPALRAPGDLGKSLRAATSSRSVPISNGPCSPPYTVDAQGRKKFRHECFTDRTTPGR